MAGCPVWSPPARTRESSTVSRRDGGFVLDRDHARIDQLACVAVDAALKGFRNIRRHGGGTSGGFAADDPPDSPADPDIRCPCNRVFERGEAEMLVAASDLGNFLRFRNDSGSG